MPLQDALPCRRVTGATSARRRGPESALLFFMSAEFESADNRSTPTAEERERTAAWRRGEAREREREDGVLAREWRGVKVPGHVQEVLSFVKAL